MKMMRNISRFGLKVSQIEKYMLKDDYFIKSQFLTAFGGLSGSNSKLKGAKYSQKSTSSELKKIFCVSRNQFKLLRNTFETQNKVSELNLSQAMHRGVN